MCVLYISICVLFNSPCNCVECILNIRKAVVIVIEGDWLINLTAQQHASRNTTPIYGIALTLLTPFPAGKFAGEIRRPVA